MNTKQPSPFAETYQQQGIYFPIPVMTAQEAKSYRQKLENFEQQQGHAISGLNNKKVHLLFTWANELVRHPAILDAVEVLIGANILCWGSEFFIKAPKSPQFVSWHQDATYWGMSRPDIVTAWLALTESSLENGGMRVIPQTHVQQMPHHETFHETNILSRGQEIAVTVDEAKALDVVLKPGEMSLHHVLLFHSSPPNHSDDRRIGLAIRYLPTHVQQSLGADSATLVRGKDEHGHFELEPSPRHDFEPALVEYHKKVCQRTAHLLLQGTVPPSF